MLARLSAAIVLALPIIASAIPGSVKPHQTTCSTDQQQCCNSLQSAHDTSAAALLGLLGVAVQGITAQVGLTCTPISVLAISGNSCNQQAVCCEHNNFNGLIALGCTPININL